MSENKATISVRAIRSFEYKTFRNLVFHDVNLRVVTLNDLKRMVQERIANTPALAFLVPIPFDTFKIHAFAHGAKTSNPIINTHNDFTHILTDYETPLADLGLKHESELSYFVYEEYLQYRMDPVTKWE